MNLTKTGTLIAALGFSFICNAQVQNQDSVYARTAYPQPSKIVLGGSFGVGFSGGSGGGGGSVSLAPRVGYRVSEDLETGLAADFSWSKFGDYRNFLLGVGPYAQYHISPQFYLGARYQHYFYQLKNNYTGASASGNEGALYLGGGYQQQVGAHSYMQVGLMYNVL